MSDVHALLAFAVLTLLQLVDHNVHHMAQLVLIVLLYRGLVLLIRSTGCPVDSRSPFDSLFPGAHHSQTSH
eukprot:5422570-Heterocapsa_arctica.AAC.1